MQYSAGHCRGKNGYHPADYRMAAKLARAVRLIVRILRIMRTELDSLCWRAEQALR